MPELDERLIELVEAARATWPRLEVPSETFIVRIARSLDEPGEPGALLTELHASDLYLATACERGDAAAIDALVATQFPYLEAALHYIDASNALIDDVRASLLEILFVSSGDTGPLIARFKGRSALRTWLRAVATRTALKMMRTSRRANQRRLGDSGLVDAAAPLMDLELAHLRARYGGELKRALEDALRGLSRRQRTLLRQHFIDGLTIDQLGKLYRVHRATAARWLVAARVALFDDTRELLTSRLGLAPSELDSIVRMVKSELDVSLHRLLR